MFEFLFIVIIVGLVVDHPILSFLIAFIFLAVVGWAWDCLFPDNRKEIKELKNEIKKLKR